MIHWKILGSCCALLAVFLFGMWLTAPGFLGSSAEFPINRRFVAVSLNGRPLNHERLAQLPTLEVRRSAFLRLRASGSGGCNNWYSDIKLSGSGSISWGKGLTTAVVCRAQETEARYLRALHEAVRWRTEEGFLILENDADVLRFLLAPR
jgi:heat shock protein HslJ